MYSVLLARICLFILVNCYTRTHSFHQIFSYQPNTWVEEWFIHFLICFVYLFNRMLIQRTHVPYNMTYWLCHNTMHLLIYCTAPCLTLPSLARTYYYPIPQYCYQQYWSYSLFYNNHWVRLLLKLPSKIGCIVLSPNIKCPLSTQCSVTYQQW